VSELARQADETARRFYVEQTRLRAERQRREMMAGTLENGATGAYAPTNQEMAERPAKALGPDNRR
jgi:hypothetical protein